VPNAQHLGGSLRRHALSWPACRFLAALTSKLAAWAISTGTACARGSRIGDLARDSPRWVEEFDDNANRAAVEENTSAIASRLPVLAQPPDSIGAPPQHPPSPADPRCSFLAPRLTGHGPLSAVPAHGEFADIQRPYIGGTSPFLPTFTRAAEMLPSAALFATTNTCAPGTISDLSAGS
jgi:hypothetical protein